MYVKSYKEKIEHNEYFSKHIYRNISDSYIWSYAKAQYYITFVYHYSKTSETILLYMKYGVIIAFHLFRKQNKYKNYYIRSF